MRQEFLRGIFIYLLILLFCLPVHAQSTLYNIKSGNGVYEYSHLQTPGDLVALNTVGSIFQWEESDSPVSGFTSITGATQSSLSFSGPLDQTTWFRRKVTVGSDFYYSNVVKLEVVSVNWENYNYVREHVVRVSGVSDWKVIDQMAVGDKLQTTKYMDGMGRHAETVSREMATPDNPNNLWGDVVSFSKYDQFGRQPKTYLPYTTTTNSGKFKTTAPAEQAPYYGVLYNENAAYNQVSFESSPLGRPVNQKKPGTSWSAGSGSSAYYELNETSDAVRIFTIGYTSGAYPESNGVYAANSLIKNRSTDENGKQVIEFMNKGGQVILVKTQLDDSPAGAYDGWICVYNVYDDFGLLRYQVQPEAVKWLSNNNWSFAATGGTTVLDELCFRYDYDEKGRNILKKAPGAEALLMVYDVRDRVVFMQDGNQRAKSPAQWTANLYDELDRVVLTTLYNTGKTVSQLQSDIDNAVTYSTSTINNPSGLQVNIITDQRDLNITNYKAQNSIEFIDGFESGVNDEFVAEIDPAAVTQPVTITAAVYGNPISDADLNNASVTTVLKYQFYDNYDYQTAKIFNTNFENGQAYTTGEAIAPSSRTLSMTTGSMTRVLNTNTFLTTTVYYDEKGRLIQSTEENILDGKDVTTYQYAFDNRLLSVNTLHTTATTGYENFSTITKNQFDKIGRISGIEKKYGSNAFKTIALYRYDDVGRLKVKRLAPHYTAGYSEMEILEYSYNIHNFITGINKDYALKKPGMYNKWGNFFGMYLGYDNRDNVFNAANLNGQVTGIVWNTQGDDAQRKFDFEYDNAGRLTNAFFKEKQTPADSWSSTTMDFTVTGYNGKIEYDLNGNLKAMLQKGVLPGNGTPVTVDDLRYVYGATSNKLLKVTDQGNLNTLNGKLGDFKDGSNGTGDDYVYDDNGNLVIDLNKDAKDLTTSDVNGIRYNYLDKPEEIRIAGKGTIKNIYDADGNKLQKLFTPEGSSTTVTTSYVHEFIYRENVLQFINFEEGRVRLIDEVSEDNGLDLLTITGNMDLPGDKRGVYDYFIRDYQGNVRMILTEETHIGSNTCTMESARATNEEPVFGQVDNNGTPTSANEVAARFPVSSIPGQSSSNGWNDNTIGSHVSRIGALASSKVGPNTLLKVMAGDEVSARTIYYYKNPASHNSNNNEILGALVNALTAVLSTSGATTSVVKGEVTTIQSNLNTINTPLYYDTSPDATTSDNKPKAYLSVLFFDERFNYVDGGQLRVEQAGSNAPPLELINLKAPKNGYAYVYVSNESEEHVYFDNIQVAHKRGRIIEENHYYSYGLKIAAISSKKLGNVSEGHLKNQYLFQGDYSEFDEDMNWNEFALRDYDPQTGRFVQIDPYYQFPSPYTGMGNDPISFKDPSGGFSLSSITGSTNLLFNTAVSTIAGTIIGGIAGAITGDDKGWLKGAAVGASLIVGEIKIPASRSILKVSGFLVNQKLQNNQQQEIEKMVRNHISAKDYLSAVRTIISYFPDVNAGLTENRDYYLWKTALPAKDGGMEVRTDLYDKLLPTILFYDGALDKVVNGENSFGLLVRMVYHEMVHVRILLGKFGDYGQISNMYEGVPIHETIAHYHMIKNQNLPQMTPLEVKSYARGVLKHQVPRLSKAWAKRLEPMILYLKQFE